MREEWILFLGDVYAELEYYLHRTNVILQYVVNKDPRDGTSVRSDMR